MDSVLQQYRNSIAEYLSASPETISLFWKGRVALYALLKSYGIKEGDEIVLPAFTCVVVPNAVIYCGAKPVYADIDSKTFNCNPDEIRSKITPRTKIIIAQNTFGLSCDLDKIMEVAREKGIVVIEDCTHGFGGFYKNKKNGTIADASFFSTQWNKPYSTGIGGIAFAKDKQIADKMNLFERECVQPSYREKTQLRILLSVRRLMTSPAIYWSMIRAYRFLSSRNMVVGSSAGDELVRPLLHKSFAKQMSAVQAEKGLSELKKLDGYNQRRRSIAKRYHALLSSLNVSPPYEPEYSTHTFLKYPLLVKDRAEFLHLAEKEGIELGDWFLSPIHPITEKFSDWHYTRGSGPVAEHVSNHIVNLPTHAGMSEEYIEKVCYFLRRYVDHLLV